MRSLPRPVVVALRVVVGAVVVGFFAYALISTWRETDGKAVPDAWRFAFAAGVWTVGVGLGTAAWRILLGPSSPRATAGFLVAQWAKHIPGGVWQAIGQVGYATSAGVTRSVAVTSLGVSAVVGAAAGPPLAVLLAFGTDLHPWARVAAALSPLGLIVLYRPLLHTVMRRIPRLGGAAAAALPSQPRIIGAWLGSVGSLLCGSVVYAVLLAGLDDGPSSIRAIGAFAAAWVVGFVVVPIPAGVGLRELVLVAALVGAAPATVIVSASVYHRLTTIVVEGILGLGATVVLRRHPPVATDADTRTIPR